MKKIALLLALPFVSSSLVFSQQNDSTKIITLKEVTIGEDQSQRTIERLPDVKDNVIYGGKKTEIV